MPAPQAPSHSSATTQQQCPAGPTDRKPPATPIAAPAPSGRSGDNGGVRTLEDLVSDPPDLPVAASLPRIAAAARPGACAVITAPPGTGKTTLVPAALAAALTQPHRERPGRILVTQPRRVAVRAAARRIARLLGERVGGQVGYTVRGDSAASGSTRVEMVTPGVLLRRLQQDPELPAVAGVLLDEFHERDLDTDLALAFLLDARAALREDLFIALTSATLEASRTAGLLEDATGTTPALIDIPGAIHPLDVRWAPPPRGAEPLGAVGGRVGVRREFLAHVARTVDSAYAGSDGDLLVFLPGVAEIERVRSLISAPGADVLPLHGRLSAAQQDAALSPGSRRRVVLSTSIAESSLTVPGVRVVVDASLAREPRLDAARGISQLATVPASRARLEQRAGRAARLGPGIAVRVMDPVDFSRRPAQSAPGIAVQDLTGARLQAAVWGAPDATGLALLDAPPAGAWNAAGARLRALGAIDEAGAATPFGRALACLPLDPPLGRALLAASPIVGTARAARFTALLSEDVRADGADLARLERSLGSPPAHLRATASRVAEQEGRLVSLASTVKAPGGALPGAPVEPAAATGAPRTREDALALTVALARPEWIARKRPGSSAYVLAGGVGALLPAGSPLEGQEWLAVAGIDRASGDKQARILAAVPIGPDDALAAGAPLLATSTDAALESGRIRARRVRRLGAIELSTQPAGALPADEALAMVRAFADKNGLGAFGWGQRATALRARLAALRAAIGEPWPDVSDEGLLAASDTWLSPHAQRLASGAPLSGVDMAEALRAMLPWPQAARLDELAPERITAPGGAQRAIDWSTGSPVLTLRVQQAFGWTDTPVLADGRLPLVLHLTSPAGRPVAVTSDLASFWAGPYAQVRAQMRGRYPKHPWPEDPLSARPTDRAKPRRR